MANIHRGEYTVKINGVDFVLKFDSNAFAELEDALGESMQSLLSDIDEKISFRFVRAALYAGMLHDRRFKPGKWTLEKAGSLITMQNMGEIAAGVMYAIASAVSGKSPDDLAKEQAASKEPATKSEGGGDPLADLIGMPTE